MTYDNLNNLLDTLGREGYDFRHHDLYELCIFAYTPSGSDCIIYYDKFWYQDSMKFKLKEIKVIEDMN